MDAEVQVNSYTTGGRVFDFSNGPDADNVLVGLDKGRWAFFAYHGSVAGTGLVDTEQVPLGVSAQSLLDASLPCTSPHHPHQNTHC